jgi:hypothetical protein
MELDGAELAQPAAVQPLLDFGFGFDRERSDIRDGIRAVGVRRWRGG